MTRDRRDDHQKLAVERRKSPELHAFGDALRAVLGLGPLYDLSENSLTDTERFGGRSYAGEDHAPLDIFDYNEEKAPPESGTRLSWRHDRNRYSAERIASRRAALSAQPFRDARTYGRFSSR